MNIRLTILLLAVICLTACEKPLAEPEMVDPIYSDLETRLKTVQTLLETERKALEDVKNRFETAPPRDLNRKRSQHEIYQREKTVKRLEEKELYHQLLIKKRLKHVRTIYPERYKAKAPWPDPEEVERYRTNQRLNSTSRNWADRVPRLADRQKAYEAEQKAAKAAASIESGEKASAGTTTDGKH